MPDRGLIQSLPFQMLVVLVDEFCAVDFSYCHLLGAQYCNRKQRQTNKRLINAVKC